VTDSSDDRSRFRPVSPRITPRFAGVPTFLRLPVHDEPADVDVLICGAPFDGGTTYRPGARFGPRGVRAASALTRGFQPAHGFDLFDKLRCADGGDILCIPMSIERTLDNIRERTLQIARAGALPAIVGGDHSISLGVLRALAAVHGPLGLIHFDAHSDTYPAAWDIDLHHGTVFRNAAEEGLLRGHDVIQLGIRGPLGTATDLDNAHAHGFRIVMVDEIKDDLALVCARLSQLHGRGPFYVSFDLDALDPAYAPGTGTPVPGGLSSYEAFRLVRALAGVSIVGCDVVEISPDHDPSGNTSLVAATLLAEMLGAVAKTRAAPDSHSGA
jgi:agmatinase